MAEHQQHHDHGSGHDSYGGGSGVEDLPLDAPAELPLPPLPRPPFWMVAFAMVSVVATWVPLALVAKARVEKASQPRISFVQDMGSQSKYKEQQTNSLFADDRAMRPKIPGTVSQTDLRDDEMYFHGFTRANDAARTPIYATSIPSEVPINMATLERGQQRFNIYCMPCHGADGQGHGRVNMQAMDLMQNPANGTKWVPVANLTAYTIHDQPDGKLFNTMTNGIRNVMPPYAGQIQDPRDRWAIIAYIRSLQFSQAAPITVAPAEKRSALEAQ
jgi:mono/diheme cytochrome c family protein